MKINVGIGAGQTFFVLQKERFASFENTCYIYINSNPDIFKWFRDYLVSCGHDVTKEHEWYEIEL